MEVIEEIWLFKKNVELYFAESHAVMLKLCELTCVFCILYITQCQNLVLLTNFQYFFRLSTHKKYLNFKKVKGIFHSYFLHNITLHYI